MAVAGSGVARRSAAGDDDDPPGLLPEWAGTATYEAGDRVERNGVAYEAKWWTSGDDPIRESDLTYTSPCERLALEDLEEK